MRHTCPNKQQESAQAVQLVQMGTCVAWKSVFRSNVGIVGGHVVHHMKMGLELGKWSWTGYLFEEVQMTKDINDFRGCGS